MVACFGLSCQELEIFKCQGDWSSGFDWRGERMGRLGREEFFLSAMVFKEKEEGLFFCESGGIRTPDQLLKRQLLYH